MNIHTRRYNNSNNDTDISYQDLYYKHKREQELERQRQRNLKLLRNVLSSEQLQKRDKMLRRANIVNSLGGLLYGTGLLASIATPLVSKRSKQLSLADFVPALGLTGLGLGYSLWSSIAKSQAEADKYEPKDMQNFIDNAGLYDLVNPENAAKLQAMEESLRPAYYDDPQLISTVNHEPAPYQKYE